MPVFKILTSYSNTKFNVECLHIEFFFNKKTGFQNLAGFVKPCSNDVQNREITF